MHNKIEELRELAGCYLKGQTLNDSQLAVKRHMAGCEECYQLFCMEYLLQQTLVGASLLPEEALEEEALAQEPGHSVILRIRKLREKLELAVQESFQKDPIWNFAPMLGLAMARGARDGVRYQSAASEESSIQCRKDKVIVQLNQKQYPVEKLAVRVSDREREEIYRFAYDDDTELHEVALDIGGYGEDARIEIIEWEKNP